MISIYSEKIEIIFYKQYFNNIFIIFNLLFLKKRNYKIFHKKFIMNINVVTLFVNSFIKKYHNSFLFLNKFTNFFLIKLNSKFIKNFFDIFQLIFTEFFTLKKNFYIFTKFDFFNIF